VFKPDPQPSLKGERYGELKKQWSVEVETVFGQIIKETKASGVFSARWHV
jgi:hypothetical protein